MDVVKTPRPRLRRGVFGLIAAAVAVAAVTIALGRLREAAPAVDKATVLIDRVKRGEMVREVAGQGTLVPTEIRWITSDTAARIEAVLVQPGAVVEPDTVLLQLSNPDIKLRALEAERELAQARAQLAELEAGLDAQRLAQESTVATLSGELTDASRRARANAELHRQGAMSELEKEEAQTQAEIVSSRLAFENKRLSAIGRSRKAQLEAQRANIVRLQGLVEFSETQVANLEVKAGSAGVVQELVVEPGQTVQAGAVLAKVVDPTRLKAELRVPETQAKDVAIGLPAVIDMRTGEVTGKVVRIDPAAQGGTVRVDVAFQGKLPGGARPDLSVDGTIEIERLASVLYVARPAFAEASSRVSLFRLEPGTSEAVRVPVEIGKTSVGSVQILSGLREGDSVILSELGDLDSVDRIRLQ